MIVEENYTGRYTLTLRQYEHIFGLLRFASDVTNPAPWIAAQDGLP